MQPCVYAFSKKTCSQTKNIQCVYIEHNNLKQAQILITNMYTEPTQISLMCIIN